MTAFLDALGLPRITDEWLAGINDQCALCERDRGSHRVTDRACPIRGAHTRALPWSMAETFTPMTSEQVVELENLRATKRKEREQRRFQEEVFHDEF